MNRSVLPRSLYCRIKNHCDIAPEHADQKSQLFANYLNFQDERSVLLPPQYSPRETVYIRIVKRFQFINAFPFPFGIVSIYNVESGALFMLHRNRYNIIYIISSCNTTKDNKRY